MIITNQNINLYNKEGFLILKNVIPKDILLNLKEECSYFIGYKDALMDIKNEKNNDLTFKSNRYFISNMYEKSNLLKKFIFSKTFFDITKSLLGNNVYLFNEQWVIKYPNSGMNFSWHQDSGYVKYKDTKTNHKKYLSCWCTLDDVNKDNGTIFILPHSELGTHEKILKHKKDKITNDLVGYSGSKEGIEIKVPAGSIVLFSSYSLHRSSKNISKNLRRIYLIQFSENPIKNSFNSSLWNKAIPFIQNGEIVK